MTSHINNVPGAEAPAPHPSGENPLLDLAQTLRAVFGDNPPSARWFQQQTKRGIIPHFKIGRLVRYNPRLVHAALELNCLIDGKKNRSTRKAA